MSLWSRLFGNPQNAKEVTINGSAQWSPSFDWDSYNPWYGPAWPTFSTFGVNSQIYRKQPAVRTVVDFLARNIGSLNPKVYERRDDDDRKERGDHPLAVRLRNPNPQTTRYRHLRDTVADIAIHDKAFWVKQRHPRTRQVVAIVRQSPSKVGVEQDQRTGRTAYRLMTTGELVSREDLVIFSGYSPDGDDLGVPPIETLRRVLAEDGAAVQHRENMWRNSARQGGVIERPLEAPEWGDPARIRFRQDWQSTMAGGANAGRTAILEEGMHFNPAAFSPKEAEYIEGRKLTYEEVALAYGGATLAALVVGHGADVKAVESFHQQLYQDVFGPWLRNLQDEIDLQLLPELNATNENLYVEFNLAEKLKGSFEEQARALVTSVSAPYLAINEARAMLNKPRIDEDWADIPVRPLNVLYGGQAAPTVPTEDPGTRLRSSMPNVKAAPRAVVQRRDKEAAKFEKLFRDHFAHQQRALKSLKAGQKADIPDSRWDSWNENLALRLYEASVDTTEKTGQLAASQIGGVYTPELTLAYLDTRSRIAAEQINETTRLALEDAFDEEDVAAAVEQTFEEARTSRASRLGLGTATALIGFARFEAAKHSQEADGRVRNKTWVVTSGNSRHPEMNGETVPVFEPFSNGMEYPGDGAGGADEVSGCKCLLVLE